MKKIYKCMIIALALQRENCHINALKKFELRSGHCPLKPGEIESDVKRNLDYRKITGPWISVFDRKNLNEQINCYHVRLERAPEMLDLDLGSGQTKAPKGSKKSGPKRMFEFLEASGPNKKAEDKESDKAQHSYSHGLQQNFKHHKYKLLAYIEHIDFGPYVDSNMNYITISLIMKEKRLPMTQLLSILNF